MSRSRSIFSAICLAIFFLLLTGAVERLAAQDRPVVDNLTESGKKLPTGVSAENPPSGIPGVTADEIIIGQWGPQSGPAAPWGAVARGTGVYFQMVTADGGIGGRRIKLMMVDDQYDPQITRAGVEKLVHEVGIFAFVGGVGTANGEAVVDYLAKLGIPWVGPATGSSKWTNPVRKTVFAVSPRYKSEGASLAKYAVQVMRLSQIACIFQDDDYGRECLAGVERQLARQQLALTARVPVKAGAKDLKAEVDSLKAAGPQAVMLFLNPTTAVLLHQAAEKAEFKPVWMTASPLSDTVTMNRLTSGRWAGTIYTAIIEPPDSTHPLMVKYRAAFDRFASRGERWGPFFYGGFGLAEPLIQALKECGLEPTRPRFLYEMEKIQNFKGVMGRLDFSSGRRQGGREMYIAEALKGGLTRRLTGWFAMENE